MFWHFNKGSTRIFFYETKGLQHTHSPYCAHIMSHKQIIPVVTGCCGVAFWLKISHLVLPVSTVIKHKLCKTLECTKWNKSMYKIHSTVESIGYTKAKNSMKISDSLPHKNCSGYLFGGGVGGGEVGTGGSLYIAMPSSNWSIYIEGFSSPD